MKTLPIPESAYAKMKYAFMRKINNVNIGLNI